MIQWLPTRRYKETSLLLIATTFVTFLFTAFSSGNEERIKDPSVYSKEFSKSASTPVAFTFFDPFTGDPTTAYTLDTLCPGQTIDHCIDVISESTNHTIIGFSGNAGTVVVAPSTSPFDSCFSYTPPFGFSGLDVITFTVENDLGNTADLEITFAVANPNTPINAGPVQQLCSVTDGVLTAIDPDPYSNNYWIVNSGGSTLTDPNSSTTAVTNLGFGNNVFLYVQEYPCGSVNFAATQISVFSGVLPEADAGDDAFLCSDDNTYVMQANDPGFAGNGVWEGTFGNATLSPLDDPNALVTNIGIGVNCFRWNLDNGECPGDTSSSTMCIYVFDSNHPIADAGEDQELCSTEFTQVNITGNSPILPAEGSWQLVSGSGLIDDPTSPSTFITGLTVGDNLFSWNIDNGPCGVDSDTLTITIYDGELSNSISAGTDTEYCVPVSTHEMDASGFDYPASGTWSLVSGSGVIVSPNDPQTQITNLAVGENLFAWSSNNGPCDLFNEIISDTVTITIFNDNQLDANAGADLEFCIEGLGPVAMAANPANYPATGSWSLGESGTATFDDVNSNTSSVTGLSIGDNELIWTIDNGVCSGITSDTINVVVFPASSSTAQAGPDESFCSPFTSYELNASPAVYPATGQWTLISGAGSFSDNTDPNATVTGLVPGIHVYRWTVLTGPCGGTDNFDDVTITIYNENAVDASAGGDQEFCEIPDGSLTVNLSGSSLIFPQTGQWTVINGSGTFTDENIPNPTVSGLSIGDNTFQWTVDNGNCASGNGSDQVTITVFPFDQLIADAGDDQDVCSNSGSTFLDGNEYSYPTVGTWTVLEGDGVLVDPSDPNTLVNGLSVGTNRFLWTIENSPCVPGTSSDEVVITVYNVDAFEVDAGTDQNVCSDVNTVTLDGNEPINPATGEWQTTGTGTGIFADASQFNTSVSGMSIGENIFVWVITNGACASDIQDSVSVIVYDDNAPNATAGIDQSICNDLPITNLEGNSPVFPATGLWTVIAGSGDIQDPTDPNTLVTDLSDGVNTFQWTISNAPCLPNTSSDEVTILVFNEAGPTANAGPDQSFCSPVSNATLAGSIPDVPATGLWEIVSSSSAVINSPTNPSTTVSNLTVGTHVFSWTIDNGACTDPISSDEITILIFDNSQENADAGEDQELCFPGESTTNLEGNSVISPAVGTWTQVSGTPATIVDSNHPNTLISGLNVGTYVFEWSIFNGNCGPITADQVTIEVFPDTQQDASAGLDQEYCTPVSDTNLSALAVVEPGFGTWTSLGSGTIDQANNPNTLVENLGIGDNLFVWTVYNSDCASGITTDTVNVIIFNNNQSVANAGNDQSLCTPDIDTFLDANSYTYPATGVWSQISGDPATIVDPSDPNTEILGLGVGESVFEWTIDNGPCASMTSIDQVTISVFDNGAPQPDAGPDQELCSPVSSTFMNADPAIDPGVGTWTLFSGTATIVDPNDPNSQITSMPIGIHTFVWTLDYETCGSPTDTVNIVVYDGTESNANAGIDQEFCTPIVSTNMAASPVTEPGFGTWTLISGSGAIADDNDPLTEISSLTIGENIFVWEVYNGTCLDFPATVDTMSIFVYWENQLVADAGEDQNICSEENLTTLEGNEVTFPAVGTWTILEGNGTFSDPNDPQSDVSNLDFGINSFIWTIDNGPCGSTTDTMTVILVNELQDDAFAGDDQEFCTPVGAITLDASDPLEGNIGTWTISSDPTGISITDENDPNTVVTGLTIGQHIFTWTLSSNACAGESSDNVSIFIYNEFNEDADAGVDIEICLPETTVNLNGNIPEFPAEGLWSYIGGGTATVSSPNNPLTLVENLEVGDNLFVYTIDNGPCGLTTDTVNVLVYDDQNLEAFAGEDQSYCLPTTSAQLEGSEITYPASGLWTTSSGATIVDPTNPNSMVADLSIGDNIFTWTVLNGDCESSESVDQVNIVIYDDEQANADAGEDRSICYPLQTALVLDGNDFTYPATGNWTALNSGTVVNPTSPFSNVIDLEPGTNAFVWTIENGSCEPSISIDTMFVFVYDNSLSPADAGDDAEYCLPENTHTLVGNELTDPATGFWTQVTDDIPAVITSPNTNITEVTGLDAGIYQFVWNVDNGPCLSSTDTVEVVIYPETVDEADAGNNQEYCTPVSTTTMNANEPIYPGIGTWSYGGSDPDVIIVDPSDPFTEITNLSVGEHIFSWTIYSGPCSELDPFYVDFVTIFIFDETQEDANAGPDQELCAPDECVTMAGNSTDEPAIGFWTFLGDYGVTYSDINDPNAEVCGLQVGVNEFTWTIFNGPCQTEATMDTMTVTVFTDEIPNPYAGEDQEFCTPVSSTSLEATPVELPNTGYWTVNLGGADFVNDEDPTTEVNGLTVGINEFIWNVYNGPCPNSIYSDTVRVLLYAESHPDSDAGPDLEVCLPNNTAMTQAADVIIPAVGVWNQIEGETATILEPTNPNTLITDLSVGTNTFTWQVFNGPCTSLPPDTMNILVFADELNIADAGDDIELCTPLSSVDLDASIPLDPTSGTWTFISGVASISDANDPQATISALTVGCYEMQWSIYNGPCIENNAFDLINICVYDATAPPAEAGEDIFVCLPEDTVFVDAVDPIFPALGTWTLIEGFGTIEDIHDPNTNFTALEPGIHVLEWSVYNGPCGTSMDTLTIQINDPNVPSAFAGEDQELCSIGGTTLEGSEALFPASVLWEEFTFYDTDITSPESSTTTVFDLEIAENIFIYTVDNGACGTSQDMVSIFMNDDGVAEADAGPDIVLCGELDEFTMQGSLTGDTNAIGEWTVINGQGLIADVNDPITPIYDIPVGVNTFEWSVDNGACGISSDEITITIYDPAIDSSFAGVDTLVCDHLMEPFQLNASEVDFPANASWSILQGPVEIEDANDPTTFVSYLGDIIDPLTSIENVLLWTVDNGACGIYSDSLIITLDDCFTIDLPDAFSPNGDGINDFFVIGNIENYENNKVTIFNRWGDLIYSAAPYNNDWDGTSQTDAAFGDVLPTSTYYIILEPGDGIDPVTGYIYLKR